MSSLHKLTPLQHLSPAITSPCLSEINIHSHHAQEQEEVSKIEKYDTAPIMKPPQVQDCDTSDNSNNNLLSFPDSDNNDSDNDSNNDLTSKSDLSDQNHVYDQVSDAFKGDIEDTSAHGDSDNTDSSGDDDYIAYDPGGISTSSIFGNATQASTTSDDTTDDSSPSSTHVPSPFNNDAADDHHSDNANDHGHDTILSITDGSLDLIKSDNSHIVYDPGSGIHFNNSLGSDLGNTAISNDASSFNSSRHKFVYNPGGNRSNSTIKANSACEGNNDPGSDTNHECDKCDFIYDPGGDLLVNNTTVSSLLDLLPPLSPYVVHLQSTFHSPSPPQKGSSILSVSPCYRGPLPSLPGAGRWPLHVQRSECVQTSVVPQPGPPHSKYPVRTER